MSYDDGMRVRREVLGAQHVDRAGDTAGEFGAPFQELITRYAWGEIWTDDTLDRRMRSAVTLTALLAHGHFDEFAMHVRAARRNGLSHNEIRAVIMQNAIYCGVPAANHGMRVAAAELAKESDHVDE
jgi:4-carboxymuconolactone decarboxylase